MRATGRSRSKASCFPCTCNHLRRSARVLAWRCCLGASACTLGEFMHTLELARWKRGVGSRLGRQRISRSSFGVSNSNRERKKEMPSTTALPPECRWFCLAASGALCRNPQLVRMKRGRGCCNFSMLRPESEEGKTQTVAESGLTSSRPVFALSSFYAAPALKGGRPCWMPRGASSLICRSRS